MDMHKFNANKLQEGACPPSERLDLLLFSPIDKSTGCLRVPLGRRYFPAFHVYISQPAVEFEVTGEDAHQKPKIPFAPSVRTPPRWPLPRYLRFPPGPLVGTLKGRDFPPGTAARKHPLKLGPFSTERRLVGDEDEIVSSKRMSTGKKDLQSGPIQYDQYSKVLSGFEGGARPECLLPHSM
jgi:hypothetical protein